MPQAKTHKTPLVACVFYFVCIIYLFLAQCEQLYLVLAIYLHNGMYLEGICPNNKRLFFIVTAVISFVVLSSFTFIHGYRIYLQVCVRYLLYDISFFATIICADRWCAYGARLSPQAAVEPWYPPCPLSSPLVRVLPMVPYHRLADTD